MGGEILDVITIEDNLNDAIKTGLQISNSNNNHINLQNHLKQPLKFLPICRQDTSVFFLAVTAPQARQIKPLLIYYFTGNTPIFSTSAIYSGSPNSYKDNDLNNIQFYDSSWALNTLSQKNDHQEKLLLSIQQKIKDTANKNYMIESRFYALGIDAYYSIDYLHRFQFMPDYKVHGATGMLTTKNFDITRTLEPAKFEHGITQAHTQPALTINHVNIAW